MSECYCFGGFQGPHGPTLRWPLQALTQQTCFNIIQLSPRRMDFLCKYPHRLIVSLNFVKTDLSNPPALTCNHFASLLMVVGIQGI